MSLVLTGTQYGKITSALVSTPAFTIQAWFKAADALDQPLLAVEDGASNFILLTGSDSPAPNHYIKAGAYDGSWGLAITTTE